MSAISQNSPRRGYGAQLRALFGLTPPKTEPLKPEASSHAAFVSAAAGLAIPPATRAPLTAFERAGSIWNLLLDTHARTHGILFIAGLTALSSGILALAPQGQDLITAVAEDGEALQSISLAVGLLWLSLQAWFWCRRIVEINYGLEPKAWGPARRLLLLTPRVVGALPFVLVIPTVVFSRAIQDPQPGAGVFGPYLLVGCLVLAALYVAFVVFRRELPGAGTIASRRLSWTFPLLSLTISFVLLCVILIDPVSFPQAIGPAAVVFLAMASILPPMVAALQLGQLARIPLVAVALGLAVVFSLWVDVRHEVGRRAPWFWRPLEPAAAARDSFDHAVSTWAGQAPEVSTGGKPHIPMILVASEGGASRAGYWTAAMLDALQQASNDRFSQSVLAISSISGGSVGAVGWVAALRTAPQDRRHALLLDYAGDDALSPDLAGMLFPDLIQRFFPAPLLPDRAVAIEQAWERAWSMACLKAGCSDNTLMAEPYTSIWSSVGRRETAWLPPVFVGGAGEESGRRILTAPYTFGTSVDADDVYILDPRAMRASTANHNGARFPWISPAGGLRDGAEHLKVHIVDGGYFDASGAETARELLAAAGPIAAKVKPNVTVTPILLNIRYQDWTPGACPWSLSVAPAKAVAPHRLGNDILAPFVGLMASRDGHQQHLGQSNTLGAPEEISVVLTGKGKDNGLPLNWVLSKPARLYARTNAQFAARAVIARIMGLKGSLDGCGSVTPPPGSKSPHGI